jgi:PAS domain S-box-containing protein
VSSDQEGAIAIPYRLLAEHAGDAFFVHDLQGRFLDANQIACESLGYSRVEILARSVGDVEIHYNRVEFQKRWKDMVVGKPSTVQGDHRRKDGTTFPVEVRVSLFAEGTRPLFLSIVRELTERRRLDEELRQSQKMEALGRLAGGVAHDFNNLLTAILGYSDVILGRVGSDCPFRSELSEVKRAGERAAQLTRQLLAFSRRQPTRPQVLELNSVVTGIEEMLRRLIPESIRVEFALVPGDLCVRVDPGQIDQVIMNLALNARDAMTCGGLLRVSTSVVEVSPDFVIKHPGSTPGRYAVLSVADTGVGIPKEQLTHLFEPFFTTKAVGKGTGLGLATVYGITKQSSGFLTVASEPGKGSTFKVYLPFVPERPQAPSESQIIEVLGGTERILLAEDDPGVRKFLGRSLRAYGYVVTEAASPEEALLHAEREGSPVDLLLTDMVMPGMSGRELAQKLQIRFPGLAVVYMSGYTEDVAIGEGRIEAGAGFIAKPFVIADVLSRIRKTLANSSPER